MPSAVDTNVLVRALVDDGTRPSERAKNRFMAQEIFVPSSVLLETEWILRGHLRLGRSTVNDLLSTVAGAAHVEIENRAYVLEAIEAHREGLDFADAMHLFAAQRCEAIYNFDASFRRKASRLHAKITVVAP